MTDTNPGHFTATLDVSEVRFIEPPTTGGAYSRSEPRPDPRREVVQVAHLVIRAETLDELREKLGKHAALI